MARVYPTPLPETILSDPLRSGERRLCEALGAQLPDRCRVFFGVSWISRRHDGRLHDGEVDFVILDPRYGLLLIEVKGGQIARDGPTGVWTSTDRGGTRHEIRDPVAQVVESKHALLEKIRQHPGWQGRWLPMVHAVAFPDCPAPVRSLAPDCPPEIVIAAPHLGNLASRVEAIFAAFEGRPDRPAGLDQRAVELITEILAPSFTMRSPLGVALAEDDRQILTLSEDQYRILNVTAAARRVAVCGGAGTGKTLLAAEKARRLAHEGFRVLLTCFNKPLGDYLQKSLGSVPNLEVAHFHQFCHDFARAAGVAIPDAPSDEPPTEYFEQFPTLLLEALDRVEKRYDAIVVDEGQDFEESWWEVLRLCFADDESGILYVFYDDQQRLYRRQTVLPHGLFPLALDRNHRNTRVIHEFAMRFYRGPRLEAVGPHGRPIEVVPVSSRSELPGAAGKVLHRLIIEGRVPTHEIAVLTSTRVDRGPFAGVERLGSFALTNDPDAGPGKVLIQTIHRFKGLERQVVVLGDVEELRGSERGRLLYAGITRARGHLVVLATPETLDAIGLGRDKSLREEPRG